MTAPLIPDAKNIEAALKTLRAQLSDADWNGDAARLKELVEEIDRLEMLASYGETHDLPF